MSEAQAYIVGGLRTPNGRYGGSLRESTVVDLAALVAREVLDRAGVAPEHVDEVVMSHCRQAGNGPNPARQVALRAGLSEQVTALTINMACASGLKAIALATDAVTHGGARLVLVSGAETMSRMPYLAPHDLRWEGVRRGDITLRDGWRDGGLDPICDMNMGETAEKLAAAFGVDREAQDRWALESHRRAAAATEKRRFEDEVLPVDLPQARLDHDECVRSDTSAEKLARLRPSFVADGTVTAGNASQMADGAAALLVASHEAVTELGLEPLGRVVAFSAVGVDPSIMGVGPAHAIPLARSRAGWPEDSVDLYEINEAFAAQIVQNVEALGLDPARVNVNGGGIALGHPIGQTGCRLAIALLRELRRRGAERGVASLCAGGGLGAALALETA